MKNLHKLHYKKLSFILFTQNFNFTQLTVELLTNVMSSIILVILSIIFFIITLLHRLKLFFKHLSNNYTINNLLQNNPYIICPAFIIPVEDETSMIRLAFLMSGFIFGGMHAFGKFKGPISIAFQETWVNPLTKNLIKIKFVNLEDAPRINSRIMFIGKYTYAFIFGLGTGVGVDWTGMTYVEYIKSLKASPTTISLATIPIEEAKKQVKTAKELGYKKGFKDGQKCKQIALKINKVNKPLVFTSSNKCINGQFQQLFDISQQTRSTPFCKEGSRLHSQVSSVVSELTAPKKNG